MTSNKNYVIIVAWNWCNQNGLLTEATEDVYIPNDMLARKAQSLLNNFLSFSSEEWVWTISMQYLNWFLKQDENARNNLYLLTNPSATIESFIEYCKLAKEEISNHKSYRESELDLPFPFPLPTIDGEHYIDRIVSIEICKKL